MSTREQMLERVRNALGRTSDQPRTPMAPFDPSGVMPELRPEDYLAKFETEWEKVGGIAHHAATVEELRSVLQKVLSKWSTPGVVMSRAPLLAELHVADQLTAAGIAVMSWGSDPNGDKSPQLAAFQNASFQANVGITGVEYVLAETGTLVLSSATEGAMMTSLAPPVHVALYRRSQLVGSLDDLLAKLPISTTPSQPAGGRSVVLITGTSRTADIEQILIRGVHGPGEAHAILVGDSCR